MYARAQARPNCFSADATWRIRQSALSGIALPTQHEASYRQTDYDISQDRILSRFVGVVPLQTMAKRIIADGMIEPVHQRPSFTSLGCFTSNEASL